MKNPRTIKPQTPLRLIIGVSLLAAALFGFLVFAVWYSMTQIHDAKMTGVIVKKEFISAPERQVTIGGKTGVTERTIDGEYILSVEVPKKDGPKETYNVWMPDKASYDAWKVGDQYDVGPRIVR